MVSEKHFSTHYTKGLVMTDNKPDPQIVTVVPEPIHEAPIDLSDDSLALQFTEEFRDKARYTPELNAWNVWDNTRWRRDTTNKAANHCRLMLRRIALQCFKSAYRRLYNPTEVPNETSQSRATRRNNAKSQAIKSVKIIKSQRTRDAVLRMAVDDPRITCAPDLWDGGHAKMLFNTPNGTVDLRTGAVREPQQSDYITKMARVSPSDMPTPHWDQFLSEATKNNQELISYLQRVFGYCLTGETIEQTMFFCHGPTNSGKSVVTNIITHIMDEYWLNTSEGTFSSKSIDRHTQDIARLVNARFVTAQETDEGSRWNEARLKRLTGQDRITARLMRQNDFEYTPQMKIFIIGNHKPSLSSLDDAIRRRFQLIQFTERVPPERINKRLGDMLETEAPGILMWMIKGCLDWQERGLNPPKIVQEYTDRYLYEEDNIASWMEECCILGETEWIQVGDLFADWRRWAIQSDLSPGSKNTFSEYLEGRAKMLNIQKHRKAKGPGFSGITLLSRSEHGQG